jgi:hypothetical protein
MPLTVKWTIGDVSDRGFEALALSIQGARKVFGNDARYLVCVNTIAPEAAQAKVGRSAQLAEWLDCTNLLPSWLPDYADQNMAEGVAWKFAGTQLSCNHHLLALDNDVILWRMPASVKMWLEDRDTLLIAEDVRSCYGKFAERCPEQARNSGMTGFPPGWNIEAGLKRMLHDIQLCSELDEQGLQVAMITVEPHRVVGVEEVSISGYFRPHLLELGSCVAHFVGVNVKRSRSMWQGRPVSAYAHDFWDWRKEGVRALVTAE